MYTFNNFKYSKELSGVLCKLRFQACILFAEDKHWKIHVIYFFLAMKICGNKWFVVLCFLNKASEVFLM